jgi:hypothetical protein
MRPCLRSVTFFAFFATAALSTACAGRQATLAPTTPTDTPDPVAAARCVHQVEVAGAAWAAGYAPDPGGADPAHTWERTVECTPDGMTTGRW